MIEVIKLESNTCATSGDSVIRYNSPEAFDNTALAGNDKMMFVCSCGKSITIEKYL